MPNDPNLHAEHGGAFFKAIGVDFGNLVRRQKVINADVLDAWYDPSPKVVEAVREHLPWLLKTSPPTQGEGLVRAIAKARGIAEDQILIGAGSSSLMFQVLPLVLQSGGRAVVLDPSYGEYPHLLETVLGAELLRFPLRPAEGWLPDLDALAAACKGAALATLVNPNTPTGACLPRGWIEALLGRLDPETRLWVDETYIDFADPTLSVESHVRKDGRLIVAKSMSKYYALSGVRVGYLVLEAELRSRAERLSPPWSVGLIAQVAALAALQDGAYYAERAAETRIQALEMLDSLRRISGLSPFPTTANFLLVGLGKGSAKDWTAALEASDVFVRDCSSISDHLEGRYIRVAVKDVSTNRRVLDEIARLAPQFS